MQMSFDFIMNYDKPRRDFNLENSGLDMYCRKIMPGVAERTDSRKD